MNRRLVGILVPVFSIRGEHDLGIGDVSSLKEMVRLASDLGIGFIQLLPINETGPDNSPYNAISSVAIEPMTIDCSPRNLPELKSHDFERIMSEVDLEKLNQGPVCYEEVRQLKHRLLHAAYEEYLNHVHGRVDIRAQAFEQFCEQEAGWLNDYCVFRYFMDQQGGSQLWDQWPDTISEKKAALKHLGELAQSDLEAVDRDLRYYAYVQWIAYDQWREVAEYAASRDVALMGDIPFGVSLYSVDVWANQSLFDLTWYGGAPPEQLFKDDEFVHKWGQNWGIPLYRWDELEKGEFAWWRQRVRKTTEIFRMFRVDHALGFYRIYSFPWHPMRNEEFLPLSYDEASERCGGRLPGFRPRADHSEDNRIANCREGEKYLKMIQEAAAGAEVIAEDLGTVPEYVRPSLERLEIAGMKVPQWEFSEGRVTSGLHYPSLSFATYATHDHAPIKSQWEEMRSRLSTDEPNSPEWWEARNFLGTLSHYAGLEIVDDQFPAYDDGVRERLVREICLSNSERVAFMIADLLGTTERINVPGVFDGSNWSYRLQPSVNQLSHGADYQEFRSFTKNVLKETARSRKIEGFPV